MKALVLTFDPNRPRRQAVANGANWPQTEHAFVNPALALADQLQRLEALDWAAFEAVRTWVELELDSCEGE